MNLFGWLSLEDLFALSLPAFMILVGCAFAIVGLFMMRHKKVTERAVASWRRQFRRAAHLDDATLRQAIVARRQIGSWVVLFGGIALAGNALIWALLVRLLTGSFELLVSFAGSIVLATLFPTEFLSVGAGYAVGISRLRAQATGHPGYAGVRPRRVSDYLPRWLGIVAWMPALYAFFIAGVAAPSVQLPMHIDRLPGDHQITLPFGLAPLFVLPVCILATVIAVMLELCWIASRPQVRVGSSPAATTTADAMLRTQVMFQVVQMAMMGLFFLGAAELSFTEGNLPVPPPRSNMVADAIVFLGFFVSWIAAMIAFLVAYLIHVWPGPRAQPLPANVAPFVHEQTGGSHG